MRTTIRPWFLATFAITVVGCGRSADHPARIQLTTYAGLLRSVSVTVGSATHPFILDTGGGETMITPDLASGIGCKPYGRAEFHSGVDFHTGSEVCSGMGRAGVKTQLLNSLNCRRWMPEPPTPRSQLGGARAARTRAAPSAVTPEKEELYLSGSGPMARS